MKNTENKVEQNVIKGSLVTDNDNNTSKPEIILPEETPTKILPITDMGTQANSTNSKEMPDEDNLNAGIQE